MLAYIPPEVHAIAFEVAVSAFAPRAYEKIVALKIFFSAICV